MAVFQIRYGLLLAAFKTRRIEAVIKQPQYIDPKEAEMG
jgi:hypothetical protein